MKNFQKRGISLLISYVLLIGLAVTMAGIIYAWLTFYVQPGAIFPEQSCPDVSLAIIDYGCASNGDFNLTVQNRGRFDVEGYMLKINNGSRYYSIYLDSSVDYIPFAMVPGEKSTGLFSFAGYNRIVTFEIEAVKLDEKRGKVLCENSVVRLNENTGKCAAEGAPPITPTCTNYCTISGSKQCIGNGYQVCGDYNGDSCFEWSGVTDCGANICQNGECVAAPPTCYDECTPSGSKRCSGAGYQTCGNYDADSCLEWNTTTSCPSGKVCNYFKQCSSWHVAYEVPPLPQNSSPAWRSTGACAESIQLVAGAIVLRVDCFKYQSKSYRLLDLEISDNNGYVFETRAGLGGCVVGNNPAFQYLIGSLRLYIYCTRIFVSDNAGGVEYKMDTSDFHIYKLTRTGSDIKVYVDNNPTPAITKTGGFAFDTMQLEYSVSPGAEFSSNSVDLDYIRIKPA